MTFSILTGGSRPYSNELVAIMNAMTVRPDPARAALMDRLVISPLKEANIWQTLDLFYMLAAHDSQAALINWKYPGTFTLSTVGAPTFTTDVGFSYDGVDDAHDTGYRWETAGLNASLNSHFMALWSLSSGQTSGGSFGASQTSGSTTVALLNPRNASDNFVVRCNHATSYTNSNTDGTGFYGWSRTASNLFRAFKDGSQIGTNQTGASTTGADYSYYIGGSNSGVPDYVARDLAWAACGSGLLVAQMSDLYTAINDFLAAV